MWIGEFATRVKKKMQPSTTPYAHGYDKAFDICSIYLNMTYDERGERKKRGLISGETQMGMK
uniref:Uncharacterized protein n=1 Tax=Nymphaea colorata TaxID=210225 RepID=A0A5K1D651_9MAGN